jgi:membrane protease YdiL (CAAX protease family)
MNCASAKKSFLQYVTGIFWNDDERRLRVLWRLAGAGVCTAILTFVFGMPFFAASGASPAPYVEKLVLYVAAAVAIWLATRFLDRRRFSDTGLYVKRDWWIDLGFGMVLGAILMTIVFLVELVAGWVTVRETFYAADSARPFTVAILLPVLLNLAAGLVEELAFRGYLLLNLAEGFNRRFVGPRWALVVAWLLTSIVFGIAHGLLPNATAVSTTNIVLAGIWLGLGYVTTGSLAVSIGAHITWNLFQGYVFGFPVSGGRDFAATFVAIEQGGPASWTGGAFGPEGGLLGLIAFLFGILSVAVWVRARHRKLALFSAIADPPSEQ